MNDFIKELQRASIWTKSIELKREDLLTHADQVDQNLYWIKEGCIRVYIYSEDQEKTIRFGYKDNIITSLDSFITGKPTEFHMSAIRKTVVVSTAKEKFEDWLKDDPSRQNTWFRFMELLVQQQLEREVDLLTDSPGERITRVLRRSPQLFQEVPHKYIASYLRMTPETLSRILNS